MFNAELLIRLFLDFKYFIMSLWLSILGLYVRMIWPILVLLRLVWDKATTFVFSALARMRRRAPLPPVFNPILLLPATALAEHIRLRKVTSVEVVRAFVTRSSDVNPLLNAIVQENFQIALQQAKLTDEIIDKGYANRTMTTEDLEKHKPFLGVPFTVMETIAVAGFSHTGGLLIRRGEKAHEDAVIVNRMKEAGAILLATTNVPELGMWWESSNPLYGRTNNPYDTRRTPGGASGGEAALMCGCGTPISIGTDTGGSIRTPAFFCGLFGHKPTAGMVPVTGCNIHGDGVDNIAVQVAGPIVRHSIDIVPVLTILAGDKIQKLELHRKVHIGILKFFMMEDDGNGVTTSSVVPQLRNVQKRVVKHLLEKYDHDVQTIQIPELRNSFSIWQEKMSEDYSDNSPIFEQLVDNQGAVNIWTEMLRSVLGRARHSFASLLQVALAKIVEEFNFLRDQKHVFQGKPPTRHLSNNCSSRWRHLKMKIQRLLGEDGILLYPSHPTLATFHRESYYKPLNFSFTAIFNALGFPVTQVPLGIEPETGLPLGIQVVGGMYMDRLTIAVAKDLENAFGGWKCPAKLL